MKKLLLIVLFIIVSAFVLCGAASAATVKTNQINIVKINNVGAVNSDQNSPAIDGNRIVWDQSDSNGPTTIYYKNLTTGSYAKVRQSTQDQSYPDVSGNIVVWQQYNKITFTHAVYYQNIVTGKYGKVYSSAYDQVDPKISGNRVVWQQSDSSGNNYIYMKDLLSGSCGKVSSLANECEPNIDGNIVVWRDGTGLFDTMSIYYKNLSTGKSTKITTTADMVEEPHIDGNILVWTQVEPSFKGVRIYYKNLSTGITGNVGVSGLIQGAPDISGNTIVWRAYTQYESAVYYTNIGTKVTKRVLSSTQQYHPAIGGTRIVWEQGPIYMLDISTGKSSLVMPDTVTPKISSTIPTNLKTAVSRTPTIFVKFTEPIKASTYYNFIKLKNLSTGTYKTLSKTISSGTLTVRSTTKLNAHTVYQVTIPAKAVRDMSNNNLASVYSFKFITGA